MPKGKRGRIPDDPKDTNSRHPIQHAAEQLAASAPPDPVREPADESPLSPTTWAGIVEAHERMTAAKARYLDAKTHAAEQKKAYDTTVEELSDLIARATHPSDLPLFDVDAHERDLTAMAEADVKEAAARLAEIGAEDGGSVTLSCEDVEVTLTPDDGPRLRREAAALRRQAH